MIRENLCDFVVIKIVDFFVDECDVVIRRDDKKRVNVKLYIESLENYGIVFKRGVIIGVIKGFIISLEFYDKLYYDNIFLVKGICGLFFEEGDSGLFVFFRFKSVQ